VQEALLATVRGYEKFGGRSSERSWLVGILKNKVVDHFRKLGRKTSFTDLEFLSDEFSEKFVSVGFWNHELGPPRMALRECLEMNWFDTQAGGTA